MKIEQLTSRAHETVYEVEIDTYHGGTCRVRLWAIVGGTLALNFADYSAETRRYGHTDALYPTIEDLPNGEGTLLEYLAEQIPVREKRKAEAEQARKIAEWGLKPRHTWPERTPEEEPRCVKSEPVCLGKEYFVKGNALLAALKGCRRATQAVKIGSVIVGSQQLGQLLTVLKKDFLRVTLHNDHITISNEHDLKGHRHVSNIKHGAWDKYHGLNGYDREITFVDKGGTKL